MKKPEYITGITILVLTVLTIFAGQSYYEFSSDGSETTSLSSLLLTNKSTGIISSSSPTRDGVPGEQQLIPQEAISPDTTVALNDPAFSQMWGLIQSNAEKAWELSRGSKNIIVAVIDTGIDHNHEDLKANLWRNPGEVGLDAQGRDKSSNGIDDDGNGFIDDVHGWNFVSNNNNLKDNHGHGTHISGIIGAQAGNGVGIAGVAPDVQMMTLKYFDPTVSGTDNLKNTIKAIDYATKMGAHIINYSGGGLEYSAEEFRAVQEAHKKGILFVAAAGNERSNSDTHKYYPADYPLDNIISVTAIDPNKNVLASSNYGIQTVHIAAPGLNILSTLPGSSYGYMTGTSQATGFVTGAAVVVFAKNKQFNYRDVKKFILSTGDGEASLLTKTSTSRRLNLYKALAIKDARSSASGLLVTRKPTSRLKNQESKIESFGKALLDSIDQEGLANQNR